MYLICFAVVLSCVYAQVELPHGHDLQVAVDAQFELLDTNQDGVLTFDEMQVIVDNEDADHDGNVTLLEYMTFSQLPQEYAEPIFNALDNNDDGILPDSFMQDYFAMLDKNENGEVTLHEYEQYTTSFIECVFGHGQHGHGADCGHKLFKNKHNKKKKIRHGVTFLYAYVCMF